MKPSFKSGDRNGTSTLARASGRPALDLFDVQSVHVIPRIQVKAYLRKGVGPPPEYISALSRELYRLHFQSGGPIRQMPGDPTQVLGNYIRAMALLQYHVSAALQLISHKEYYSLLRDTDLTPHALTLLRDEIAELPSVGSLHKLLTEMFPIIKLVNGYVLAPVEPSYRDLQDMKGQVMAIYNETEAGAALISNVLKPYGISGISMAGFDHLAGLTQTEDIHYNITSLNPLTKLGWPYFWADGDMSGLGVVIDPSVHVEKAYISPQSVAENLLRLGINHASTSYGGGKIMAGRGNFPTVESISPEPLPIEAMPSDIVEPAVASPKQRGGKR